MIKQSKCLFSLLPDNHTVITITKILIDNHIGVKQFKTIGIPTQERIAGQKGIKTVPGSLKLIQPFKNYDILEEKKYEYAHFFYISDQVFFVHHLISMAEPI